MKTEKTHKYIKHSRNKSSAGKKKSMRPLLVCAAIFIVIVGAFAIYFYSQYTRTFNSDHEVRLYIPTNSTEDAIADTLSKHLGDDFAKSVLKVSSLLHAKSSKSAGSYLIKPEMSAGIIAKKIVSGRQDPVKVTYNNLRTIDQLAQRISSQLEFSPEDFMTACDSVLPSKGYDKANYLSAFLPDTYEFYWNVAPATLIEKLSDHTIKWWTTERVAKAESLGLTPNQVYTLASIVDEETQKTDEKPIVARLYLNRLDKGMKLQADPTVKFAVGDFDLQRIYSAHLKTDSPYNTYLYFGLPPGPIRMVPTTTLEAVLNAPKHDYIYICAKEDFSGHNFAVTLVQHNENARRYYNAINKLGIK